MDVPIAIVHWMDNQGIDKNARCYDSAGLKALTNGLEQKNHNYFICLTSIDSPIPFKRATRHFIGD